MICVFLRPANSFCNLNFGGHVQTSHGQISQSCMPGKFETPGLPVDISLPVDRRIFDLFFFTVLTVL